VRSSDPPKGRLPSPCHQVLLDVVIIVISGLVIHLRTINFRETRNESCRFYLSDTVTFFNQRSDLIVENLWEIGGLGDLKKAPS
jgi:ABC-type uncharacterized transport system permease subunit